jgi:type II secretion system protein G
MKKAFTLVELLVVITIMSILTIVTVSQFQTAKKKANDVARKGDLNAVAKALQMYYADYGEMPSASATGQIEVVAGSPIDWGSEFSDRSGYIYMKILPRENKLTTPYCYKTSADKKSYALFAMLENTQDIQCINGATYRCGNNGKQYCFAYASPNISLDEEGDIQ